jgi:hypothetical protein
MAQPRNPNKKNTPLESSIPQNVGSIDATETKIPGPEVKSGFSEWINKLYLERITEEELKSFYDAFRYKGFNRDEVLLQLKEIASDTKVATQLIILCALQGPQRASKTKLLTGRTPVEMGIPASGGQGKTILTCNKITAATADLAAYYLKQLDVPKRLNLSCPGWLQFPSAGSIKLSDHFRQLHTEFATQFSVVIGGTFQPQIYQQMVWNAYLNDDLHLFE